MTPFRAPSVTTPEATPVPAAPRRVAGRRGEHLRPPVPALAPGREVSAPSDAWEVLADRVAEAARAHLAGTREPVGGDTIGGPGSGDGAPLAPRVRARFEAALGVDLGAVRLHTGPAAAAAARSVDAAAFTVREHVTLGEGYRPGTPAGEALLAHELAHVALGHGTDRPGMAHRQALAMTARPGTRFWVAVPLTRPLDADALLLAMIRTMYHLSSDAEAERVRVAGHWAWAAGRTREATAADVARGRILLPVSVDDLVLGTPEESASRGATFAALTPDEQAEVESETDRRFFAQTGSVVGASLGDAAVDRDMASFRAALREEVLRQRQQVDTLPLVVHRMLTSALGREPQPAEYDTTLRIAAKLGELSVEQLVDLDSGVVPRAGLAALEERVDAFRAALAERRRTAERSGAAMAELHDDLLPLYRRYRELGEPGEPRRTDQDRDSAGGPGAGPHDTAVERLDADLRTAGIAGIGELRRRVREWVDAFEAATLALADAEIDRYLRMLTAAEVHYGRPETAEALHRDLSRVRTLYAEAGRLREQAQRERTPPTSAQPQLPLVSLTDVKADAATARAERAATTLAGTHPLLADRKLDRSRLVDLPSGEAAALMVDFVRTRRGEIETLRQDLHHDPQRVWRYPPLLERSRHAQGVEPGSIHEAIVDDHARDLGGVSVAEALVVLLAIVLGVVSGGTGSLAVLAAAGGLALGATQAYEEFRQYELDTSASTLGLLSDDPSFVWVLVALAGTAVEAGGVVRAVRASSSTIREAAAAYRGSARLRAAVSGYRETGDLPGFRAAMQHVPDADQRVVHAIREAVEARAAEQSAAARRVVSWLPEGARAVLGAEGSAERTARVTLETYVLARRGQRSFAVFLRRLQEAGLVGDGTSLAPATRAALEREHADALRFTTRLLDRARELGWSEERVEGAVRRWAASPTTSVEQVLVDVEAEESAARAGARPGDTTGTPPPPGPPSPDEPVFWRKAELAWVERSGGTDLNAVGKTNFAGVDVVSAGELTTIKAYDGPTRLRRYLRDLREITGGGGPQGVGAKSAKAARDLAQLSASMEQAGTPLVLPAGYADDPLTFIQQKTVLRIPDDHVAEVRRAVIDVLSGEYGYQDFNLPRPLSVSEAAAFAERRVGGVGRTSAELRR